MPGYYIIYQAINILKPILLLTNLETTLSSFESKTLASIKITSPYLLILITYFDILLYIGL